MTLFLYFIFEKNIISPEMEAMGIISGGRSKAYFISATPVCKVLVLVKSHFLETARSDHRIQTTRYFGHVVW
jgi:hypothetical protein